MLPVHIRFQQTVAIIGIQRIHFSVSTNKRRMKVNITVMVKRSRTQKILAL